VLAAAECGTPAPLLLSAQRLTNAARRQQRPLDAGTVAAFTTVYDDIVCEGEQLHPVILKSNGKPGKQSEAHTLLRSFRVHVDAILRFIAGPSVTFTINVAERAVRMLKVKQKISGCFRTVEDADNFCVIRSFPRLFTQARPQHAERAASGIYWRSDHARRVAAE
jgi:transposase